MSSPTTSDLTFDDATDPKSRSSSRDSSPAATSARKSAGNCRQLSKARPSALGCTCTSRRQNKANFLDFGVDRLTEQRTLCNG